MPTPEEKLKEIEEKLNAVLISVEKTRRYFLIIIWITVISVIAPLIGLIFALPSFLDSFAGLL